MENNVRPRSGWIVILLAIALAACAPEPVATLAPEISPTLEVATAPPPTDMPTPNPLPPTEVVSVAELPRDLDAYQWRMIVSGLNLPVDIQNAGDGSGRLFIVEQPGTIRILANDQLIAVPFLDIRARVGSDASEQGLLGLAFHPQFSDNGFFYVNYTDNHGDTVIARFTASDDQADPTSEKILLRVNQPYENHNGGALAFGPDGYLYIGLGDGGSGGDPQGNGQSLNTLLGKILRIDVDHGDPYAIPADNPFGDEIWAYGLRNPWRFSFDRATGDLWIGDVGQGDWEEIDFVPAGAPGGINFGWNRYEGFHDFETSGLQVGNHRPPVLEYGHGDFIGGCSVTGGVVYHGALAEWDGVYFYGDFCSGNIWGTVHTINGLEEAWNATRVFATNFSISTFGQDQAGEIYLADYGNGMILRLERK